MDFDDAVRYVRGRLRLGVKLGNERFLALLERLGNPQNAFRAVHVAGTKGKGSTAVMAAAVLRAAGYRTGAYLSPYVYDVRERIQIDGVMIPREDFARWVEIVKPHVEALEETDHGAATEFELKTAIGFCYFAEQKIDYAVVEVGLGGRLDATNVFESPLVTAITTIGYDHVELLGPTLADIAREKAGIVKPGIPCVTGVPAGSEADGSISTICRERGAPLLRVTPAQGYAHAAPGDITYDVGDDGALSIRTTLRRIDGIRLRLRGSFQHGNAAVALGMLDAIAEEDRPAITDEQARIGLREAYLPGRLDHLSSQPVVVVDGAHNELAAGALARALREDDLLPSDRDAGSGAHRRLILVVGMSRNHAPATFLEPLLALHPAAVIATQPEFHPRDAHEVAAVAADAKVEIVRVVDSSVADACREALSLAAINDVICLTGSFYTVGDVSPETWRKLLEERK